MGRGSALEVRDRLRELFIETDMVFVTAGLGGGTRTGAAPIVAEVIGYAMNSDAADPVVPDPERVAECMTMALDRAGIEPGDIEIINTHATATELGDEQEAKAVRRVFGDCPDGYVNNTKSFIGHAMGAAGALELAGNLGAFDDGVVHPTINVTDLDPKCAMRNLVINEPKEVKRVDYILNNSFGMLGTNSAVVVKRYER